MFWVHSDVNSKECISNSNSHRFLFFQDRNQLHLDDHNIQCSPFDWMSLMEGELHPQESGI